MNWLENILRIKKIDIQQLASLTGLEENKLQTIIEKDIAINHLTLDMAYHIFTSLSLNPDKMYHKYKKED